MRPAIARATIRPHTIVPKDAIHSAAILVALRLPASTID